MSAASQRLETDRLILRTWQDSDSEPFAAMNADPRVMEFMPALLSRGESDALMERIRAHFRQHGFALFAAELRAERVFIGFVGLSIPSFRTRFTPCVEIGWRLAAAYWNQGLATEGAREVIRDAFENLQLPELVSFTTAANLKSRRVMEKLGFTRDPADDFENPNLPEGHPQRPHVLYRLGRSRWAEGNTRRPVTAPGSPSSNSARDCTGG